MPENLSVPDDEPTKPLEESDFQVAEALLDQLDEQGKEQLLQVQLAEAAQAYKQGTITYDQYERESDYIGLQLARLEQRSQHNLEAINNDGKPLSRRQKFARAAFGHSRKA